jgi:pimeloyl-ACP methyl ester carboxylesterase
MKIVCLHGAGESAAVWGPQVRTLEDVEAINFPGHGGEPGQGRESVEAYADWVRDQLGRSEPLVLAGHSLGGAVALSLALRDDRPKWLAGLILAGTGARLRVHPDIFRRLDEDFAAACELLCRWSIADISIDGVTDTFRRDLETAGKTVVRGDFTASDGFDVMDRVGSIKLPSLVVVGSEDHMTPPKFSRYLCGQLENSTLVMVPGAGHVLTLERPDQVSQAMEDFRADIGDP